MFEIQFVLFDLWWPWFKKAPKENKNVWIQFFSVFNPPLVFFEMHLIFAYSDQKKFKQSWNFTIVANGNILNYTPYQQKFSGNIITNKSHQKIVLTVFDGLLSIVIIWCIGIV